MFINSLKSDEILILNNIFFIFIEQKIVSLLYDLQLISF